MKLEMKKSNLNDGVDVYKFLCDLGIGENGFHMTPPSDEIEFKELLKKFLKDSEEIQPIGRVMQEIYWMYIDNEIVGILKLRPQLNGNLLINGGNMGISISPKFRGNGYGKLIIKKGVELLKEKGVYKVLITIYENNIPSRKAVESNGGILYDINEGLCRYWIDNTVDIDKISFDSNKFKAMIELHIEQGRVLDLENKSLGIVKGIVGLKWFKIIIKGESNHAGATPMKYRLDPVAEGCKLISEIPNIVKSMDDSSIVATVGKINIFPNQTNIIAKFIEFTIDLRGIDEENLLTVIDVIGSQLDELKEKGFYCEIEQIAEARGVKSSLDILDIIENTIKIRKYNYTKLYSGANHDTSILGQHIPSAMIFVPSIDGRSHCKEELTKEKDVEAGCQILCDTIVELLKK